MRTGTVRIRQWIFYLVYYLISLAVVARMLPHYLGKPWQYWVIGIFILYFVFLSTERIITSKVKWYFFLYVIIQSGLVAALMFIPTETAPQDYFFNLIIPMSGQAIWDLQTRAGRFVVAGLSVFSLLSLIITYPSFEGAAFGLTYVAACILVAVLSTATLNSTIAQDETQKVLNELRLANQKLVEYSQKVENLAAAEERNHLARELHDSVSQTIFSMTLTAEAAKMLLNNEHPRIQTMLDHLQSLSQNALVEMRTLIQKLRPHSIVECGLEEALRQHIIERRSQDGLDVDLHIDGKFQLSAEASETIFRIIQEALNNVVKHSHTKSTSVVIDVKDKFLSVSISDEGTGFTYSRSSLISDHIGLQSMEERARSLGANFNISSETGKGTRISINQIPMAENSHQESLGVVRSEKREGE